jgi:DTW domain-containing protein YfiP
MSEVFLRKDNESAGRAGLEIRRLSITLRGVIDSTIDAYLKRKARAFEPKCSQRTPCPQCRKPPITCYCATIRPFESKPRILILMSPQEFKHRVGTGRMAHQCLSNSQLIKGAEFAGSAPVETILRDPKIFPMLLFPGPTSLNLSNLESCERQTLCPPDRELLIVILDATWNHAKQMLHRSPNLQALPRICFTPPHLSRFLVRRQPHEHCFSSIEAIHQIIELMNPLGRGHAKEPHDHLIEVFDKMVLQQLNFRVPSQVSRSAASYVKIKARRERMRALRAVNGSNDLNSHGEMVVRIANDSSRDA